MEKELSSLLSTVAEIEISYTSHIKPSNRLKIIDQEDAYNLFLATWDTSKIELVEQLKVMLLNKAFHVLGICTLTSGNISGTIVDPKQIFVVALKANATSIIIAHNHPSGSLIPSANDYKMTKKIKAGGDLLDLRVLDHFIITSEGYFSFASEGIL